MAEDSSPAPDASKEVARVAYILAALCILAVGLIFASNSDRIQAVREAQALRAWPNQLILMIDRNRLYTERGPVFYSIVVSALVTKILCEGVASPACTPELAANWFRAPPKELMMEWAKLGGGIHITMASTPDNDLGLALNELLRQTFADNSFDRIAAQTVQRLLETAKNKKWSLAIAWIVLNDIALPTSPHHILTT